MTDVIFIARMLARSVHVVKFNPQYCRRSYTTGDRPHSEWSWFVIFRLRIRRSQMRQTQSERHLVQLRFRELLSPPMSR